MADRSSDEQLRNVQREIRESIRRNHPNPERIGCGGGEKIRQMPEGTVPPPAPAYHHVMECSPCYEELMAASDSVATARKAASARRRILVGSIAAIIVVAAVLLYLFFPRAGSNVGDPPEIAGNHQPGNHVAIAMLNLDSEPTQRSGDGTTRTGELQHLPRKELDLTINLPRGMEEGTYDVELDANSEKALLSTAGIAQIQNGLTVVVVNMDLSHFAPGKYRIRIRRQGESWRVSYVFIS